MLVFLQPGKVDLLLFYTRESLTGGSVRTPKPGLPTTMPRSIFADLSRGGVGMPGYGASEKPLFHPQWLVL